MIFWRKLLQSRQILQEPKYEKKNPPRIWLSSHLRKLTIYISTYSTVINVCEGTVY